MTLMPDDTRDARGQTITRRAARNAEREGAAA
jgi:hypothetical protein